jgi:phosphohistidine swiveling domain-containing protein
VVGAANATHILKTGSVVTVDADRGLVFYGTTKS